ncbi:MAG: hypothetical protein SGPRY_006026, partial [Prymnesium sp.]
MAKLRLHSARTKLRWSISVLLLLWRSFMALCRRRIEAKATQITNRQALLRDALDSTRRALRRWRERSCALSNEGVVVKAGKGKLGVVAGRVMAASLT